MDAPGSANVRSEVAPAAGAATAGASVTVLLIDPHTVIRHAVRRVLEESPRLTVIGEAGTAHDGILALRQLRPDLVVTELRLPDASIVSLCRAVRFHQPDAKIVILTAFADEDEILAAVLAGAGGCVSKQSDHATLSAALLTVAGGGSVLAPSLTMRALGLLDGLACADEDAGRAAGLTPREDLIFSMIGEGLTDREIADCLVLRVNTVRNHVATIYAKLNVGGRREAAQLAAQRSRGDKPRG